MNLKVAIYNGKYLYNDMKQFFDGLIRTPEQETYSSTPAR
jgi:hypothetical protein